MEVAFHILYETKEPAIHCQDLNAASLLINVIAPRPKTREDIIQSFSTVLGASSRLKGTVFEFVQHSF